MNEILIFSRKLPHYVDIPNLSFSLKAPIEKEEKELLKMININCWEFTKCGRELKGENAHTLGICPAAVFSESDGFCAGKNGGRACMYIAGTLCSESIPGTHRETSKDCGSCDFYRILKLEHGHEMSVFTFQRYINDKNRNSPGLSDHEIYNSRPLLRKEAHVETDSSCQGNNLNDIWLRLLSLVDYCNHAVKQGEWYEEDKEQFYSLKDSAMKKFYHNPPSGAGVSLKKVPYADSSNSHKEDAVSPMKHKHSNKSSGYSNVMEHPPVTPDVQETVLIEMEVTHAGRLFCFHIPAEKAKDWELDMTAIGAKKWIPSCEFNRQFFKEVFEEIQMLLNQYIQP